MAQYNSIYTTLGSRAIGDSTPVVFTAGLAVGATSGTLSGNWPGITGDYIVTFSDAVQGVNAETRDVTLTNGATTATWVLGLRNTCGPNATASSYVTPTQNIVLTNLPALLTSSNTTSGIVLTANPARIGWSIQNQGTNPVYVCFGLGASSTQLNYVLKASTGATDGTGGSISFFSGAVYNGVVTVAGTSFSVSVVDLTI